MKIKLTLADVELRGLQEFYNSVARAMNIEPNDVLTYDCRQINVSVSIQSVIFDYYEQLGCLDEQIGMLWCCSGPKVDKELQGFEIEAQQGFITLIEST